MYNTGMSPILLKLGGVLLLIGIILLLVRIVMELSWFAPAIIVVAMILILIGYLTRKKF